MGCRFPSARVVVAALFGAALSLPAGAGEVILTASDGASPEQFGSDVALSGDVAVVASFSGRRPVGVGRGTAYVFRAEAAGWTEEQELYPSDDAPWIIAGLAGPAVAVDGDLVVVGAEAAEAAYVYRFDGSSWREEAKLFSWDPLVQHFGHAVAVSGDVIVVGAYESPGPEPGAAFVFRWNGASWVQEAEFIPGVPGSEWYGYSVAVEGDVAVVGAKFDDTTEGNDAGSAYVYRRSGSTWALEARLLGDATVGISDNVGESVAISGAVVAVGAPDAFGVRGKVFVYRWNGSAWAFEAGLSASDASVGGWFGRDVDVSGDRIVAGSYPRDAAYVFAYGPVPFSPPWTQIAKIQPSDLQSSDNFAAEVAIEGARVLAGSAAHDTLAGGDRAGAAYLYDDDACANSIDDDLDGAVDLADGGCSGPTDSSERDPALPCDDTADGDGDGADAFPDDLGCSGPGDASERDAAYACDDDVDGDADGSAAFPEDAGCTGPLDPTETDPALPCDDGDDEDGDGFTDYPADPGCFDSRWPLEDPQCQNGLNDDGQAGIDFDGGASVNGGVPIAAPDAGCLGLSYRNTEKTGCGLGFELAPLLLGLGALRRRRNSRPG